MLGPGTSLEDAEGLFDSIGKTFSSIGQAVGNVAAQAAPVLVKALPGVVSGLVSGAPAGPLGMLTGAVIGGVGSALGPGAPAPPAAPGPPVPRPPGGIGGAIAPFLAALGSPSTQQALQQMLLGSAGAPTVPIAGGTAQAPVSAITGMLGSLLRRATEDWETVPPSGRAAYLSEAIDLGNPEARGAWLYEQLLPIPAETVAVPPVESAEPESEPESAEPEDAGEAGWLDETYDEEEAYFYAELLRQQAEDAEDSELYSR